MEKLKAGILELDRFILGAGRLGEEERRKECFAILDRYLDAGFRTLDVARSYCGGRCEEFLGQYLKKKDRSRITIISKGGFPLSRTEMYKTRLSEKELRKDLEASLKALGTDYIDLYFLHRDKPDVPPEEMLYSLNKFIREGKVREIGASNWSCGRIGTANRFAEKNDLRPFAASQINFSYALTTPALTGDITHITMNDIEYRWYRENAFPLIAYSVQAKGFFTKYFSGEELKKSGKLSYLPLEENFRRAERIRALSLEKCVPIPALLISYVLSKEIPAAAIGGFSNTGQLEESLPGAELRLTKQEIQFLEGEDLV